MILSNQIEKFLLEFQQIASEKGVKFWERPENVSMMKMLGLNETLVTEKILLNLTQNDYCEGPLSDKNQPSAWCFGKTIKGHNVYIKLTIVEKKKRKNAFCISFHESTKPLNYPYR